MSANRWRRLVCTEPLRRAPPTGRLPHPLTIDLLSLTDLRGMYAAASIESLSLAQQMRLLREGFAEFEEGCWAAPDETRMTRTSPRGTFLAFEQWLSSLFDACERQLQPHEREGFGAFLLLRLEHSYVVLEVGASELLGTLLIRCLAAAATSLSLTLRLATAWCTTPAPPRRASSRCSSGRCCP